MNKTKKIIRPQKVQYKHPWYYYLLNFAAQIINTAGIPGLIIVFLIGTFLYYGSLEQKREFIDTFLLLKNNNLKESLLIPVVGFAVLVITAQNIFFKKRLSIKDHEITRLANDRNSQQEVELGKPLSTSTSSELI